MQPATCLRLGALSAGLAVALGAIGAHLLRGQYGPEDLERFEKAVRYQMYHAIGILLCGLLGAIGRPPRAAAWAFLLGTLLFSGSLYALVLTQTRAFGHVTPFGGLSFLIGWGCLVAQAPRLLTRP